jgi:putative RNA 2'-phosphotransferase
VAEQKFAAYDMRINSVAHNPRDSRGGATTKVSDWVRLLHMNRRLTKISKYLSFILRHHPESIGLKLDPERWGSVDALVKNANSNGKSITLTQVQEVVALNEQKLFVFSDDGLRIRAS